MKLGGVVFLLLAVAFVGEAIVNREWFSTAFLGLACFVIGLDLLTSHWRAARKQRKLDAARRHPQFIIDFCEARDLDPDNVVAWEWDRRTGIEVHLNNGIKVR